MKITINGNIPDKEANIYIQMCKEKHKDKYIKEIILTEDGEYVNISFTYDNIPIERIRRITGYLVGTIDRFNDAKRAEVEDRVKHSVTTDLEII